MKLLAPSQPAAWTVWFTGLSGSGKTTLAIALARRLTMLSVPHQLLDGDEIRKELCRDLGFSKADRHENVRRISYVAGLLNRHKIVSIVAAIAPFRAAREEARKYIPRFVEVHVDCPLQSLVQRDVKGLYKRALSGEIKNFTGISDPYEPPLHPDIYLNSGLQSEEECRASLFSELERRAYLPTFGEDPFVSTISLNNLSEYAR